MIKLTTFALAGMLLACSPTLAQTKRVRASGPVPQSGTGPVRPGARLLPVDEAGFRKLIESHRGKVVLINFWATWCEPCRQEMPALAKLAATQAARGFRLVTISADLESDLPKARAFLRAQRVPFPAYYKTARDDDAFINAIDRNWSGALPALFLYARNGTRVASFIGETEIETIATTVEKALRAR